MKTLTKILWYFIYALPAILFFSYHPVISLGSNESMNFEFSLPLIWLVLFDLGAFILMMILGWKHRNANSCSKASNLSLCKIFIRMKYLFSKDSGGYDRGRAPETRNDGIEGRGLRGKRIHGNDCDSGIYTTNRSHEAFSSWGKEFPGISNRRFFLLALFPLYLTISIFWSSNQLRGLLTAGIMWLIFFAIFAMLYLLPQVSTPRRLRTHVLLVFFVSSVLVCKYCYAQSIMDILGLSRDTTLLCAGCTYRSFGFPHPSGFAIEPQFMGNLLLAPTLTALYLVVFRNRKFGKNIVKEATYVKSKVETTLFHDKIHLPNINWQKWKHIGMIILAGFLSMTLFFTFSRGAIYAYAVALVVMLIFALKRRQFSWNLITIPVVSFLLSLGLQGTFAAVGPTAETFTSAVTKSIHQLSLGIIDLRSQPTDNVENSDPTCGKDVENSSQTVENTNQNVDKITDNCAKPVDNLDKTVEELAGTVDKYVDKTEEKLTTEAEKDLENTIFEGYVAESTNIRLKLSKVALWTWVSAPGREGTFSIGLDYNHSSYRECNISTALTPTSILFGVGLGGAGTAMHAKYPDQVTSPKEIVQHEGFSLLLETGLVGIVLAIFGLLIALFPQLFSQKFLDGRSAGAPVKSAKGEPVFWRHPALPLLLSLIVAYLVTLNFFSGLPNALQIYLMPPLLYLIFRDHQELPTN